MGVGIKKSNKKVDSISLVASLVGRPEKGRYELQGNEDLLTLQRREWRTDMQLT